jgi:hypothetical protein
LRKNGIDINVYADPIFVDADLGLVRPKGIVVV